MRHTDSSLQRMIRLRRNPTPVSPNVSSVQLKRKHCSPGLKTRKSQETWKNVQVHNRYGHLYDSEDESVWNLTPNDSPSPMDQSPSEKGDRRADLQRARVPTEANLFPSDLTPIMAPMIKWNCRSLKANYIEITLLVHAFLPITFCLQETHL